MLSPRRPLLLLTLLLAASCGDDNAKTGKAEPQRPARHVAGFARQSVPDLGRLVPADAVALVVFAPSGKLRPKLDLFLRRAGGGAQPVLDQLLALSGTSPGEVDPDRALAVALTLGEKNQPQPTFILPAKGGDYVAKGHAAPAAANAPPLARDLPGGDIVFRVDLARLVPAFRPLVDPYLSADGLVGVDPALSADPNTLALLDAMGTGARALLEAAERLEGAVVLDGGRIDLNLALAVKEGSALDTPPAKGASFADLAKSIDAKRCAMTLLMRGDWREWEEAFVPLYRSMYAGLPDGEERLQRYLAAYGAMYEVMGPSFAAAFDFDAEGMRFRGALRPTDPEAYLARYRTAIREGSMPEMGAVLSLGPKAEVEGVALDTYRVDIDWKKVWGPQPHDTVEFEDFAEKLVASLFGPQGIRFAQGVVGDHVIMAMPDAEGSYAEAVKTARRRTGGLSRTAAAALTDDTTFLLHVDLRRVMSGIIAIAAEALGETRPPIQAHPPIDLWIRIGQSGRTYSFALHADVGDAVAFLKNPR